MVYRVPYQKKFVKYLTWVFCGDNVSAMKNINNNTNANLTAAIENLNEALLDSVYCGLLDAGYTPGEAYESTFGTGAVALVSSVSGDEVDVSNDEGPIWGAF
jgi:hypothetical protein